MKRHFLMRCQTALVIGVKTISHVGDISVYLMGVKREPKVCADVLAHERRKGGYWSYVSINT